MVEVVFLIECNIYYIMKVRFVRYLDKSNIKNYMNIKWFVKINVWII